MSALETIKAAYAAFGRNDPSVLLAAMDPGIRWNEAEGNPVADRKKNGGGTLDAPFCHVFRFQGDKIVTFQQYTDTAQWARLW